MTRSVGNAIIYILIFIAAIVAISALAIWLDLGPVAHSALGLRTGSRRPPFSSPLPRDIMATSEGPSKRGSSAPILEHLKKLERTSRVVRIR